MFQETTLLGSGLSAGDKFRAQARQQLDLFRTDAGRIQEQYRTEANRPHANDPITLRRELVDRSFGQGNTEVRAVYERKGLLPEEEDRRARWDMMVAKAITRVLLSHYRGHFWVVECDSAQGIAWISIPVLLGEWKYVFHLTEDITPAMIIRAGGEILERFNLPRSNLDIASFIAARKNAVRNGGDLPA